MLYGSVGFDKHLMSGFLHCCIVPDIPGALVIEPFPLPHGPDNHLVVILSVVLPVPKCRIVGIIQCIAFSVWLLLLSNMVLNFFHVFLVT